MILKPGKCRFSFEQRIEEEEEEEAITDNSIRFKFAELITIRQKKNRMNFNYYF